LNIALSPNASGVAKWVNGLTTDQFYHGSLDGKKWLRYKEIREFIAKLNAAVEFAGRARRI
jgi:hypothetical protein